MNVIPELGLPSYLPLWLAAVLLALSFIIGMLAGLIGLSLGTMRLPAMLLLGVPLPAAASANILISSLTAISGSIRHLRDGRVKLPILLVAGLPAFIAGFLGGFFSGRAPVYLLFVLAGVLILWQGTELALLARRRSRGTDHSSDDKLEGSEGQFTPVRLVGGGAASFGLGLLAGAIGLVLGSVRLPLIIRLLQVDPRIAAGSNLFIGMVMGGFGWVGHLFNQPTNLALLLILGVPAVVGSYIGARLTGRISVNLLLWIMGGLLTVSGIMMLWRGFSALV